jgi:hypothetical protein
VIRFCLRSAEREAAADHSSSAPSPELAKDDIYALILILALIEFPSTDLLALSCLVPEKVQQAEQPMAAILA